MKRSLIAAVLCLISCAPAEPPAPRRPPADEPPIFDIYPFKDPPLYKPGPEKPRTPKPANIVYLDPDEFPEAPPELRRALSDLGCRIPQVFAMFLLEEPSPFTPDNLVVGYFKSSTEQHWAVVCSRSGASALLLFDSAGTLVEEVEAESPDEDWLQDIDGEGTPGFSWYIAAVDRAHMMDDHEGFGGPAPPPILHEGLESGFAEKASHIFYWHDCQWIHLQGAD